MMQREDQDGRQGYDRHTVNDSLALSQNFRQEVDLVSALQ